MNRQNEPGTSRELEAWISHTLRGQAGSIQVTSADTEKIRRSVHRRIEEESGMKRWNVRKTMVVAAAICVFGCITAVAAGKVAYTTGHSSHLDEFTYDKLGEMETELGYKTKAPETFANGYRFDTGVPTHNESMDEDGNVMKTGESFSLTYKKDGMPEIFLSAENVKMYDEEEKPDQTLEHNGIALGYSADQYLFVPPDYQVSEEDKAREAAGELYISYGSSEVQHSTVQSISWEDGGVFYCMNTFDNALGAQDLAQMCGEVIDNK